MGADVAQKITVALAGNPNVGKSTLFNALTGLHQHTGNWPGKTVSVARGKLHRDGTEYLFVDLPGTYSLEGKSEDEQIAAEYIKSDEPDCTVVVCDGSCLERSLLLALQILQLTDKVVVCVNLLDEAQRHGIVLDREQLSRELGAPVVFTSANREEGLDGLVQTISDTVRMPSKPQLPTWKNPIDAAEEIVKKTVQKKENRQKYRFAVDRLFASRRFGIPLMFLLLLLIIWLTVWGANYPSMLLEQAFDRGYGVLNGWMQGIPWWIRGVLLDGVYLTSARVISVMLPPMAIFFPLFTLLEDIGYLPRMAFLLDRSMCRCGGCGKQALTLCMGLGCNAVGVMGCRIIDSPRERLVAILTNAMIPCNGRFPTLILLGSLFFPQAGAALIVATCVVLGVVGVMAVSGVLSKTALRAEPSTFLMEIPPFRRPRLGQILIRSLLDRTIFVAGRALVVAAPAGVVLWCLSTSGLFGTLTEFLDPVGRILGMNGIILLAFCLSLPANELLVPVILMGISGAATLYETGGLGAQELLGAGFTLKMAVCTMAFTMFHWPCSTTLLTVKKETGSIAKTAAAAALPTAVGILLCLVLNLLL